MISIDSDALGLINKSLGVTGRGAPVTELLDGEVNQTLDIAPIVRRSRTQAATDGLYRCVLRNVHGAANTITSSETPYNIAVGRIAPYPNPMPPQFDIWLLWASLLQVSGSGTLSAVLSLAVPTQGWGIDDSGVAVVSALTQTIAAWDALFAVTVTIGLQQGNGPLAKIGLRLPRDLATNLLFRSTSSAVATFECQFLLGVFPVGLGQDGVI